MKEKAVGIVANPASGKDIRRIVTYSTPYGNQEKVNIIRRVLMALHATGIRKVYYMPEYYNIVPQAANGIYDEHKNIISDMVFEPLDFMVLEKESDTIKAGQMMQALDVDCVITLGGDGTNRAFAKYAGTVPIVPVSTGTNNAFPTMVEGTLAGLAAGVVAMGQCENHPEVLRRMKKIDLYLDGEYADMALVDLVVLDPGIVGAKAMWQTEGMNEIFVSRCSPFNIGISAIPGQLDIIDDIEPRGLRVTVGREGSGVLAAIAPGLIVPVHLQAAAEMKPGEKIPIASPSLIALDGERNTLIKPGQEAYVALNVEGPVVVDVDQALKAATENGFFKL
ncbi:NAD(+)/NADH kinase [Pseudoramibacter alactolyticus]|uniref:NAD(+)/NADH kinase n=1 Tax=Pseudoramibacter alactolyticus TaxID=113287 RepID=UPI0028E26B14|nr:NAD(+)/NADH kinase [Pseudoramibacter alactolyticus]